VLLGHEENEIKGYDNLNKFVAAVDAAGLSSTLTGPGPLTVLAPTDSAFAACPFPITAEVLKYVLLLFRYIFIVPVRRYHIIPGSVSVSSISGDQVTAEGSTLKYKRFARKTFLDDAIIGQGPSGAATGEVYPVDVQCDNGIIHTIDIVNKPGYQSLN